MIGFGNFRRDFPEGRINSVLRNLRTKSDQELEKVLKDGFAYAHGKDALSSSPVDFWELATTPDVFYEGIAAMRILGQRRGEDYPLSVLGYRKGKPKTFSEKLTYLFTGELPLIAPEH